jgi:hypothetical protein
MGKVAGDRTLARRAALDSAHFSESVAARIAA